MGLSPSPALLRLREADIVRLCGLAAAGDGLRLVGEHRVQHPRRHGGRLVAAFAGVPGDSWVEAVEDEPHPALRWGCGCAVGVDAQHGALACAHVAALLSAWLRDPAAFVDTGGEPPAANPPLPATRHDATEVRGGKRRSRPAAAAPAPGRSTADSAAPSDLRAALVALPARQRALIARQVLGSTSLMPEDGGENVGVEALAAALADHAQVARLLEGLEAPARALFRAIHLRGGKITAAEMDGLAGRHRGAPGAVATARQQLEACGLLFRSPSQASAASAERHQPVGTDLAVIWFIPLETARAAGQELPLRPLPTVALHGPPRFAGGEDRAPGTTPQTWVRQAPLRQLGVAAALLAHMDTTAIRMEGRAPARRAAPRNGHGAPLPALPVDPPPGALVGWARATHLPAGLLLLVWRLDHTGERHEAAPLGALARLPVGEWAAALRSAFRAWLECETYAEVSDLTLAADGTEARCDPRHPALRRSTVAAENTRARRFVVELAGRLREGAWYGLDDLLDLVWWVHPFFLRERQRMFSGPAWWLAGGDGTGDDGSRPLDARMADEWRRGEGRYILALLLGPLHWWGALDLAGSEGAAVRAVRLTPVGSYLLGHTDAAPGAVAALASGWGPAALPTRDVAREASSMGSAGADHDGGLAVQPLAAPPALLDALTQWARVTGIAGDRLLWRFSPDLACRAFDAGIDPAPVLTLLRAADTRDQTRVAPGVVQLLEGWRTRYGASRIAAGAMLLEAVDAPSLREALALAPTIAARCRLLGPTLALVPADAAAALAQALDARGFVV